MTTWPLGALDLKVLDLDREVEFYERLGLTRLPAEGEGAVFGAGARPILRLRRLRDGRSRPPRSAGLYHFAVLLPSEQELGGFLRRTLEERLPLTGTADHFVSQALYFDDPEGNGIEVYCDRPSESWEWTGSDLKITTDPLDIDDILREVPSTAAYPGAPNGLRIGHVHLRVGDVARAETFYRDALGLDITRRRHGASFMSSGRYHHHLAGNVWHSAGAGRRDESRAGLSWFAFEAADAAAFDAAKARLAQAGIELRATPTGVEADDPWGTRMRITRA